MKFILILVIVTSTAFADYAQRRHKQAEFIAENVCTVLRFGGATVWQTAWINQCEASLNKCFPTLKPTKMEVTSGFIKDMFKAKKKPSSCKWIREEWCHKPYITGRDIENDNLNEGTQYDECVSTMSEKIEDLMLTIANPATDITYSSECDPNAASTNSADSSVRAR